MPTSLIITEMQLKTTSRLRMAVLKRIKYNKCWEDVEKWQLLYTAWRECKLIQSSWEKYISS
jgi:hypothetical protein